MPRTERACCGATDLPGGILIYAAGEGEPHRHEVVHLGPVLEIVILWLYAPPDAVLAQVRALAERIRVHAHGSWAA